MQGNATIEVYSGPEIQESVMSKNQFWPLDYDPEGAIYESPSWDLPGFRPNRRTAPPRQKSGPVRQTR
jgi:hypothetical protein